MELLSLASLTLIAIVSFAHRLCLLAQQTTSHKQLELVARSLTRAILAVSLRALFVTGSDATFVCFRALFRGYLCSSLRNCLDISFSSFVSARPLQVLTGQQQPWTTSFQALVSAVVFIPGVCAIAFVSFAELQKMSGFLRVRLLQRCELIGNVNCIALIDFI